MAEQLIEAIAQNQINQQGVAVVLKILHATIFTHCSTSMAEQLIAAIAHNQISQQDVTVILNILHATIYTHL